MTESREKPLGGRQTWRSHITRDHALQLYMQMPDGTRSLHELRRQLKEKYGSAPTFDTIAAWSSADRWADKIETVKIKRYEMVQQAVAQAQATTAARQIAKATRLAEGGMAIALNRLEAQLDYERRRENGDLRKDEAPPIDVSTTAGLKRLVETVVIAHRYSDMLQGKIPPDDKEQDRSSDHAALLGNFLPEEGAKPN